MQGRDQPLKTVQFSLNCCLWQPASETMSQSEFRTDSFLDSFLDWIRNLYTGIISITEMGIKLWGLDHIRFVDYGVRACMRIRTLVRPHAVLHHHLSLIHI